MKTLKDGDLEWFRSFFDVFCMETWKSKWSNHVQPDLTAPFLATAPRRDQAGLDKLRAIIQGNLGFIFATPLGRVRPGGAK